MATIERQLELERKMVSNGVETFERNKSKAEEAGRGAETTYARRLMQEFMQPLIEALTTWLADKTALKNGRVKPLLNRCEPEKAMFIAMQALFNSFTHEAPLAGLATRIGRMIEDEVRFRRFQEMHGAYYDKIIADFKRKGTTDYRYRHRVLTHKANEHFDQWIEWTVTERAEIGMKLIDIILTNTDLIQKKQFSSNGRNTTLLLPTAEAQRWIEEHNEFSKFLFPDKMPCIICPDEWTALDQGGFYTPELRNTTPMIKTSSKRHRRYVEESDLSQVMRTLNIVQSVPWEVNQEVHTYVKACWSQNLRIGMPQKDPLVVPNSPFTGRDKATLTPDEQEALTDWKHEAAQVYTQEKERVSKAFQVSRVIRLANEFANHSRFYFVWFADFRGRLYPTTAGFNPQSSDVAKGLLRFNVAKPVGERGWYWLRVHGANRFGNDKLSYDDRVRWVDENTDHFLRAAYEPLNHVDVWGNADKPWQFLAWLFEFRDAHALQKLGRSAHDFVSRVPVGLDGSCNGLQNFSAMLRDPIGGRATNLVPAHIPADIYTDVAAVCTRKLQALDADPMARLWLEYSANYGKNGVLPRSTAKRPVMTLPYGATRQSCTEYIFLDIIANAKDHFPGGAFKAAIWLTPFLWASIGEVVVAARDAMEWLQKCSGIVTKANEPLMWKTVDGFPVYQGMRQIDSVKVETQLAGRFQLRVGHFRDEFDRHKQRSGVSPNFVHSKDGDHLRAVVRRSYDEGIHNLALVHDDYGTHACDTDGLHKIIREEFVRLHTEHDALKDFKEEHEKRGFELPDVPASGTLNLQDVLQSEYFFG